MASQNAKRDGTALQQSAGPASNLRTAKKKPPENRLSTPPSLLGVIEGARDLGEGYVILKVQAPGKRTAKGAIKGPVALFDKSIPGISDDDVKMVIRRINASTKGNTGIVSRGTALPGFRKPVDLTDSVPVENAKFINKLAADAMADRQRQVKEGNLLSAMQVRQARHVTRQAISKAVSDHRLFSIDGPSGTQLFPAFFVDPNLNRRDLEQVSVTLGDIPGPSKWQFFTTPKASLGGKTPVEALETGKGDLPRVLAAAAAFRER